MKKELVECLNCNGKSYNIIKNKNNNLLFIKMCEKCHGRGKIYWVDNILNNASEEVTHFVIKNLTDDMLTFPIDKKRTILVIDPQKFKIFSPIYKPFDETFNIESVQTLIDKNKILIYEYNNPSNMSFNNDDRYSTYLYNMLYVTVKVFVSNGL